MANPPSARTLQNRAKRVVLHRESLDLATRGVADAMQSAGMAIAQDASDDAPRDPAKAAARGVPEMADTWFVQVWADGKRAGGVDAQTLQAWQDKPRGVRVPARGAMLIVGFRSPISHFAEQGTIKESARPFLVPAWNRGIGQLGPQIAPAMGKRLRLGTLGQAVAGALGYRTSRSGAIVRSRMPGKPRRTR